uniref:Uncharacterized protein n=1 Tax=Megaselia scalaris TaxID=36166 RepID=T1GQ02_MEGSC
MDYNFLAAVLASIYSRWPAHLKRFERIMLIIRGWPYNRYSSWLYRILHGDVDFARFWLILAMKQKPRSGATTDSMKVEISLFSPEYVMYVHLFCLFPLIIACLS